MNASEFASVLQDASVVAREKRCSSRGHVTTRELYDRTISKTHFIHRIFDVRARESSATKQKAETLRPSTRSTTPCRVPNSCLRLDNKKGEVRSITKGTLGNKAGCLNRASDRFTVKWCDVVPFDTAAPTGAP